MSTKQGTTNPVSPQWEERGELLENLQISLRYYRRRERFFDKLEKICNSLTVLGGTAVVGQIFSGWSLALLGVLVALSGVLPLVFSFAEQRFLFRSLAVQACEQICEIEVHSAQADVTDKWLASIKRAYAKLQAQEPPTLAILALICEQDYFVSRDIYDKVEPIPWWVRLFAHLGDLRPAKNYVKEQTHQSANESCSHPPCYAAPKGKKEIIIDIIKILAGFVAGAGYQSYKNYNRRVDNGE